MKAIKKYADGGKRGPSVRKAKRVVNRRARQEERDAKRNPKHAEKQLRYELNGPDPIMDVISKYSEKELAEAFRKRRTYQRTQLGIAAAAAAVSRGVHAATQYKKN